ncbi:GTP-binding export factor binds to signal sequence, GTP and RNA [Oceanococcus atlanticus]|uniref:Signal recognition particle protein n=1 Tax=Oceanococcus atlanticus TaxID=1317117 RepID=A0A1Y1SGY7_9GAMM|nr:signal recognition particle protein [Oceanococcus atlanticus]ORE88848.1 GTP-binding export factor binds to signal sequence, GTP and RNA [Oceanococcus atlanticus]
MFESLSENLQATFKELRGQGRLTEDNIKDALRQVRRALLEADVALDVVRDFIDRVKERALGEQVRTSLTPGQEFISIVREELITELGGASQGLELRAQPPAVILMAGLQGSGKTTSTGKLARYLLEQKKRVLVVSCDVYRPAAIDQLKTVAEAVSADFHPSSPLQSPAQIADAALAVARKELYDVLIVDTAGRQTVDEKMMQEIKGLHDFLKPAETLFVIDSMTGQDAAKTAAAFGDALALTGVVLTKVDGDARGGAALSVRKVTGKPIKFLGVGEKLEALEVFHPERLASRILGMGDVLSLIEEAEKKIDRQKAEKLAQKFKKGKGFDLEDYRDQLAQMVNMGGLGAMLDKLPGMSQIPAQVKNQINDKEITRAIAIINSMTLQERRFPDVIKASRKKRIAAGSGTQVPDVNRLLKQHMQMQKMMKRMRKGGMANMMRGMQGMMPPGGMPRR